MAGAIVQGTREAGYLDLSRQAGFAGFHWSAASLAYFFGLYILILSGGSVFYRWSCWVLTGAVLLITITKGLIAAYILVTLCVLFRRVIGRLTLKIGLLLILMMGSLLPVLTSIYEVNYVQDISTRAGFVLYTLFTRITEWWPYMMNIITDHSSVIFGRGLGSFGAASIRYDELYPASGDNMYLYIWANLGIPGLIYIIGLIVIFIVNMRVDSDWKYYISMQLLTVIVYGITVNVVEFGIFGFMFGIILSHLVQRKGNENYGASGNSLLSYHNASFIRCS